MITARKIDFVKRNHVGVPSMRSNYTRAAARRESLADFTARMNARNAPPKPWGKILSAEEIEKTRTDERAKLNLDQFSEAEQMALLHASFDRRHQIIWHRLRLDYDVPPFTGSTFRPLSERGLVRKRDDLKMHVITDTGMPFANAIADEIVTRNNLHLPWIGSHVGATASVHCTCKWSAGIRYGDNTQANAQREHSRHLREIGKA